MESLHEEAVLEFQNHNISEIVTPVDPDALERLLKQSNYDDKKTEYLVKGFRSGLILGNKGPHLRKNKSKNILLTVGTKVSLWNKVMKEVQMG